MHHFHQLEKQTHKDFLLQQRVDPITGELIEAGHKIVICSACKSAFFEESWEYLGGKHCNQNKTLSKIPVAQTLWIKAKPLEFLPFEFEGFDTKKYYQNFLYESSRVVISIVLLFFIGFTATAIRNQYFILASIYLVVLLYCSYFIYKPEKLFSRLPNSISKHLLPISKTYKIACDANNQLVVFKNTVQELGIEWKNIRKIRYSIRYVKSSSTHSDYIDWSILKIIISFTDNGIDKERELITQLRRIHFYKWKDFLKQLPTTIEVYVL